MFFILFYYYFFHQKKKKSLNLFPSGENITQISFPPSRKLGRIYSHETRPGMIGKSQCLSSLKAVDCAMLSFTFMRPVFTPV